MIDAPRAISTTPDWRTTVSGSMGTHGGTWARKGLRAKVRWEMPAKTSMAPRAMREMFWLGVVAGTSGEDGGRISDIWHLVGVGCGERGSELARFAR